MILSGHEKRVTLSLARCSAVCANKPELMTVLGKLPDLGYNLDLLEKADLEILYAEFDESLEAAIKAEFVADPAYLIDLGAPCGVCPLCGHIGCRWIFRIMNVKGGKSIECGSECICTHGLHVKGTETAEEAKAALEKAVRDAINKIKKEAWHQEYGFEQSMFETVKNMLKDIRKNFDLDWKTRRSAQYKIYKDLPKLERFYAKHGWLGTELKWNEWRRIAGFARQFGDETLLPYQKEWVTKEAKSKKAQAEAENTVQHTTKEEAVHAPATASVFEPAPTQESTSADKLHIVFGVDPSAEETVVPEKPKQLTIDFNALAYDLVFGADGPVNGD